MVDASLLAFSFSLGVGTFFSPCAVALVPSYAAYFMGAKGEGGFWSGLRFGAWASAGVASIFVVAAMGLYWVRERLQVPAAVLDATAGVLGVLVGLAFVGLGVLVIAGRGPSWSPKINAVLQRNPKGMFLWGILFGLGSLGCSLPLTLAALALALGDGGLASLVAYALGLVGIVLVAGPVLGLVGPTMGKVLARSARPLQIAMGVLLLAGGIYVTLYYLS